MTSTSSYAKEFVENREWSSSTKASPVVIDGDSVIELLEYFHCHDFLTEVEGSEFEELFQKLSVALRASVITEAK